MTERSRRTGSPAFAPLSRRMTDLFAGGDAARRATQCRHRPARPGDPVFRGVSDRTARPRRTGSPAFAALSRRMTDRPRGRRIGRGDESSRGRIGRGRRELVNLTLTTQRPRPRRENAPAAWTLQSLSCKTNKGMRVRKSGTDLSRRAGRAGKVEDETSVEPRVLRLLGREARRRAGAGSQRDRARRGARTARRHLRAVL